MPLIRITEENVGSYVVFLLAHTAKDEKAYLEQIDLREMLLEKGEDYFFTHEGENQAAFQVYRAKKDDNQAVSVSFQVTFADPSEACFRRVLQEFFEMEAEQAEPVSRHYVMSADPSKPVYENVLEQFGFKKDGGRCKLRRDPAPVDPEAYPLATRALGRGYTTRAITLGVLDADPALAARMADIFNRAFKRHDSVGSRNAEDTVRYVKRPKTTFLGLWYEEEIVGYTSWIPLNEEILVTEISVLRRHWGTGAADLLSRDTTDAIHTTTGRPVVAYAEGTNAASIKMMKRVGLDIVENFPVWRLNDQSLSQVPEQSSTGQV